VNTAGPSKHQAVALRCASNLSAFYRCAFDGYRDTLDAHSLLQFYNDCRVAGTVEFIFGNAAAVFPNCTLSVRLPLPEQKNSVTAQGKIDASMATDSAFQFCNIFAGARSNCSMNCLSDAIGCDELTTACRLGPGGVDIMNSVVVLVHAVAEEDASDVDLAPVLRRGWLTLLARAGTVGKKVWQPGVDALQKGEELQFDTKAYNYLRGFIIGWPCLSSGVSASTEVIAEMTICPFEAVNIHVQTQLLFARERSDGLPKFVQYEVRLSLVRRPKRQNRLNGERKMSLRREGTHICVRSIPSVSNCCTPHSSPPPDLTPSPPLHPRQ
jgi:hypothetical protein